jgi:anti-anti-sigma factor
MGSRTVFTVASESLNGVASVALRGELDLATASEPEAHPAPFENGGVSAITLDLRELSFIYQAALPSLVRARECATTNGQRLILVGARPSAQRLFELTDTEYLLDDPDTVGELNRSVGSEHREDVQRDNGRR